MLYYMCNFLIVLRIHIWQYTRYAALSYDWFIRYAGVSIRYIGANYHSNLYGAAVASLQAMNLLVHCDVINDVNDLRYMIVLISYQLSLELMP